MSQAQVVDRRGWWDDEAAVAGFDFGLATETEAFEGAFRLLHDTYVEGGYMDPHPTGRRVGIFNALPTTKVFVARDGGRVVGTVTLVQDSRIGLPMDQVYRDELAPFRARGRRLGEACTLTVDPGYRAVAVPVLMRLYRMLSLYAARVARLHDYGMTLARHHGPFYRRCFPVRPLGPLRPYPRINDYPVLGFRVDLGLIRALLRVAESGVALGGRYDFFFAPRHSRPVLARLRRDLPASAMTPGQVAHFFAGLGEDTAALAAGLTTARDLAPALTA
jgi:hypothetical protein